MKSGLAGHRGTDGVRVGEGERWRPAGYTVYKRVKRGCGWERVPEACTQTSEAGRSIAEEKVRQKGV